MDNKSSKINYEKRPVPSAPGPQQITTEGQSTMKGSSEITHPLPKKNLIPGPSSVRKERN